MREDEGKRVDDSWKLYYPGAMIMGVDQSWSENSPNESANHVSDCTWPITRDLSDVLANN